MDDIGALLSSFGDWLLGIADFITSAIASGFEAAWIFATDWAVLGFTAATSLAAARMAGFDIDMPTPADVMAQLPMQIQIILERIGLPEAFGYWSYAVTARFGILGLRMASYLRAW